MATITPTVVATGDYARTVTWANMAAGDVGLPTTVETYTWENKSIQVTGLAQIQISNDGVNWENVGGVYLSNVTEGKLGRMYALNTYTKYIRPFANGGPTPATVTLFCSRHYGNG